MDNIIELEEFKMTRGLDDEILSEITVEDYLKEDISRVMIKAKYEMENALSIEELIKCNVKIEDILTIEENRFEPPLLLLEAPKDLKTPEELLREEEEYLKMELKFREFDRKLRNLTKGEKPSFLTLFKQKITRLAGLN